MNDDELTAVLLQQRGTVKMTTPVEQIISRGHAVRTRHHLPRAAAALSAAGAAVFALTVPLPANHAALPASLPPASHPAGQPGAQLAAWTVTRQADGTIRVTFREATDPAGLQRTLRADGVPVSVTFTGHKNPACQAITPAPQPPFRGRKGPFGPLSRVIGGGGFDTQYALAIQPSAIPSGEGLQIWTSGTPGAADNFELQMDLVQASPQCTGS